MTRDITIGDTFFYKFTTRQLSDAVPTVLTGSPVVVAYENDSTDEITAGITLGVDHDSKVGFNLLTIVATTANGYENGKDYALTLTAGTVGGTSVIGEVILNFTIGRTAAAIELANGTDGLTALATLLAAIQTDMDNGTDGFGALLAAINASGGGARFGH